VAKDDRLYGKFTQDFADNPKILPLSDSAFRCLVEATLYSRRMMTDGFLATRLATAKWPLAALEELASNDPLKPSLFIVDGGWTIHDFSEHQDTKADIEARRTRNTANGRLGGVARAKRLASKSPSEIQAETETETETTTPKGVVPRKRGTRIPEPFIVTGDMRAWAATRVPGVNVDSSTEKFANYWRAKTRDATKHDWRATWDNWLISDFEKLPTQKPRTTAAQKNLTTVEHFAQLEAQGLEIER